MHIVVLTGAMQGAVIANAAVLISDTFTPGDGTGTIGGSVNGQNTEIGGVAWSGRNVWEYSGSGTLVVDDFGASGGPNTRIISVPVSIGGPVTLSADVIPPTTANPGDWSALGFAKNSAAVTDSGFYSVNVGQIWMLLTKSGDYSMVASNGNTLATGPAPIYNASGFNHLELDYDPATHITSGRINGISVVSGFDLDTISFTPFINEAGVHLFRSTGSAADNLLLTSVAVPEPGAILVFAGVVGLVVSRRARGTIMAGLQ
jgi:hypothetical protein